MVVGPCCEIEREYGAKEREVETHRLLNEIRLLTTMLEYKECLVYICVLESASHYLTFFNANHLSFTYPLVTLCKATIWHNAMPLIMSKAAGSEPIKK